MIKTPRHPFIELTIARILTTVREPEILFWGLIFPTLMALGLGIAFTSSPEPLIVVGVEETQGADHLIELLDAHRGVEVFSLLRSETAAALRDGRAHLVVTPDIPPTYRYDPTRPESRLARLVVDDLLQGASGRKDIWSGRENHLVAPGSRYIDWLVPGLLGMNIMGMGMWGIGFSVVVQRSRKLLKWLIATPMRRFHFLGALVAARLVFLGLETLVLLGSARLVFGIPIEGSMVNIAAVSLLGAVTFGSIGLLVASRVRTIEGVSGIINVVMVPMWIASGVFFASSNFPDPLQPLIQAMPLTALVDALRGVMLNGDGLKVLASELLILSAWGSVSFAVALKLFVWR